MKTGWYCAKCGCDCWGILSQQIGNRKADRKKYCRKCADIVLGKRDEKGMLK